MTLRELKVGEPIELSGPGAWYPNRLLHSRPFMKWTLESIGDDGFGTQSVNLVAVPLTREERHKVMQALKAFFHCTASEDYRLRIEEEAWERSRVKIAASQRAERWFDQTYGFGTQAEFADDTYDDDDYYRGD